MKIAAILLTGLSLLPVSASVQARGIDCSKASTKLDMAICADSPAIDYDRRMAVAYDHALASWNGAIVRYVRLDQQQWLTAFRTIELEAAIDSDCVITDPACIRDELRKRVDDIESGAYIHSGVYRSVGGMKLLLQPGLANGYRVRIYDPSKVAKVNIVTRDGERAALWDGPQFMLSIMGDANGLPFPPEDGCTLRMSTEALAIRVSQKGACGGHSFEGTYDRLLDETLRGYELELH
jgi:uncharacterized protein YecT (DUF1311 family)